MSDLLSTVVSAGTFEGNQELRSRSELTAKEVMREVGAVLRMSEADVALLAEVEADPGEDQTMIINMGPQHPSTHGVLRLLLTIDGEIIKRVEPDLGYIHRSIEKMCERDSYQQIVHLTDRMDYLSSHINNEAVCLTVEKVNNHCFFISGYCFINSIECF